MSKGWTTAYFPEETKRMDHFSASRIREMARRPAVVEELCEILHDGDGYVSAKPWREVNERYKDILRAAVPVMLDRLADLLEQP